MVSLPSSALAQDSRKDSVWNGVVAGAAIGGGVGLLVAKTTDSICSAPTCMALMAVAGGAVGHLVDGAIGKKQPVVPGQWIDDSMGNGALIGAGAGSAVLLVGLARDCGTGQGRVPCTTGQTLNQLWRAALFGAAVGALVDAAIPARAPGGTEAMTARSRRLSVAFRVRF
jgi:hypothetical protein